MSVRHPSLCQLPVDRLAHSISSAKGGHMNLRIPGPTPLPPEGIEAMARQMINHRGPEFETLFRDITDWLKVFFETENKVYVLTSSGTGAMEAAIVNTLSRGDRVLSVPIGVFGERFAKIAEAFGADVERLEFPMGQPADPDKVAAKIATNGPYKAVLLTQNETSTGVTNDLESLCKAIHGASDPSPLILIDGISGIGAIRLQMDAWGCDVVISGSQKAWMAPPGLAFICMSPRAWEAYETADMPRFYFDLGLAERYAQRNQTPATPNVAALYGLHVALKQMVEEGVEAVAARHQMIADHCRQRALEAGLGLYANPAYFSNTVTAVTLKEGMNTAEVLATLRDKYDIHCGSSKAPGVEMIRIGHMGYVSIADIDAVFDALVEIMAE